MIAIFRFRKLAPDMTNGPILPQLLLYALPLAASGILQLLYNAADIIVVGQYADETALAAVTSTGSLINLIVNLFIGLAVGAIALTARYCGAQDSAGIHRAVHTAISLSLIGGVLIGVLGFFAANPLLQLMDSPDGVIDQATLYVQLYFLGMPAIMVYNFGAGILNATGDTRRPLVILACSGLVNVGLNLLLVIVFDLDVAGVAIATSVSQYISAVAVTILLLRSNSATRLYPSQLRIYKKELLEIIRIGIPSGLQGFVFSLSNVLIQSTINSFGAVAIAGSGAAANIEGFAYTAMNAFSSATLSFTSQNVGARKPHRINRIYLVCLSCVFVAGSLMVLLIQIFKEPLLGIYSPEPEVIAKGIIRIEYMMTLYFTVGMMEVGAGMLRGLGFSITPMIISLLGACGLRILWIYTVFPLNPTLECLFISYPVSWILTFLTHLVAFLIVRPRVFRRLTREAETLAATDS